MRMDNNIVTYEPDNSLKKGYFVIFSEIFSELKRNKWLTYQLFKRNFFAGYKQSFLGIFWRFITPIISVGTFMLLNHSGILKTGDINVPYPLYALTGLAFWQIFAAGLIAGSNSLVSSGELLKKINLSKKSLVVASIGQSLISFLIQFILVGILFLYYRTIPNIGILLTPLVIIPLLLFTLGISFIFALFNSFIRDIGNAIPRLIPFLMFLMPILYAKPKTGILTHFAEFNPLYYFISTARDLILKGAISEPKGFIISSFVSVVIFVGCLFIFHLTETRITERV